MLIKQINKMLGRFLGWIALLTCSFVIRLLPSGAVYGFARRVGALAYRFAHKQRTIALENLTLAFGQEKSRSEIETIARQCFTYMASSAIELLFLLDRPQQLRERVRLVNQHSLVAALGQGHGVILVSAHFGNFPLLLAKLALEGYKAAGIMRFMRDARVERIFAAKRRRLGIKTIYSQPRSVCVNSTIDALRNNEIVFIPLDQNFGTGGVFVDFFGKKAATATGPIVLAQRTEAQVLPCFIHRLPDDRHEIIFEDALELEPAGTSQEVIVRNIQKLTSIIERYVRRFPEEWGWIHRRWKAKPPAQGTV